MSNETQSEGLTLSSASTGISFIVGMAAVGCLLAGLPLLRPCLAWLEPNNPVLRQPLPLNVTLCCLALGLLITALGPVLLYFSCWGRWRIDNEGIEFRHFLKKRPLYLRWRDVDQVHWAQMQFGLQGKGVRLRAYWDWFPKSKRDEARSRLEAFLSREFDLSTVPIRAWSFEPNFHSRATWALKIVGLGTSVAAAILVSMLLVVLFTDPDTALGQTICGVWFAFWYMLICLPVVLYLRSPETRRLRQLNPYWRTRRAH